MAIFSNFNGMSSPLNSMIFENSYGPVGKYIVGLNYNRIGEEVRTNNQLDEDVIIAAISICRRRFKQKDIVLIDLLDEDKRGEKGIVFSENTLFYWDSIFLCSFDYKDIEEVDYNDDDMTVTVKTVYQEKYELECGGQRYDYYSRYMYNFLMDIKDFIAEKDSFSGQDSVTYDENTYFDEEDLELVDPIKGVE